MNNLEKEMRQAAETEKCIGDATIFFFREIGMGEEQISKVVCGSLGKYTRAMKQAVARLMRSRGAPVESVREILGQVPAYRAVKRPVRGRRKKFD